MPAMEPRRPAVGMARWIQLPRNEVITLTTPIMNSVHIPMCQVSTASFVAR